MEKTKTLTILLWLLLLGSVAFNIYQLNSNPIKDYHLLYGSDTTKYQLYVRNDADKKQIEEKWASGGRRVKYEEGLNYIRKYRCTIKDDPTATKYVSFTFDSVFNYMGYILTEYAPGLPSDRKLGFRVFFAQDIKPTTIGSDRSVYQKMILLAPTSNMQFLKSKKGGDYDFFDQGSICPIICPDDLENVNPDPTRCNTPAAPDSARGSG